MIKRKTLNNQDLKLLRDIVADRRPSLLPLVEQLPGGGSLNTEEREELREVLADEMLERGLRGDGEPDPYGLRIDALIGGLGNF